MILNLKNLTLCLSLIYMLAACDQSVFRTSNAKYRGEQTALNTETQPESTSVPSTDKPGETTTPSASSTPSSSANPRLPACESSSYKLAVIVFPISESILPATDLDAVMLDASKSGLSFELLRLNLSDIDSGVSKLLSMDFSKFDQMWVISSSAYFLKQDLLHAKIAEFYHTQKKPVALFADSSPWFLDANQIAIKMGITKTDSSVLFNTTELANGWFSMKPEVALGQALLPGQAAIHPLFKGAAELSSGNSPAEIDLSALKVTAQSLAKAKVLSKPNFNLVSIATLEKSANIPSRILLDSGWTKFGYSYLYEKMPDTKKYIQNIACFLASP